MEAQLGEWLACNLFSHHLTPQARSVPQWVAAQAWLEEWLALSLLLLPDSLGQVVGLCEQLTHPCCTSYATAASLWHAWLGSAWLFVNRRRLELFDSTRAGDQHGTPRADHGQFMGQIHGVFTSALRLLTGAPSSNLLTQAL